MALNFVFWVIDGQNKLRVSFLAGFFRLVLSYPSLLKCSAWVGCRFSLFVLPGTKTLAYFAPASSSVNVAKIIFFATES
jgi:hypothetical protein